LAGDALTPARFLVIAPVDANGATGPVVQVQR